MYTNLVKSFFILVLTFFLLSILSKAQVKLLWENKYTHLSNSYEIPHAIRADNFGNIYVGGNTRNYYSSPQDYLLIKFNKYGILEWDRNFDGSGRDNDLSSAILVTDSGSVYITGYCSKEGGGISAETVKYNSEGSITWQDSYNGPDSTNRNPSSVIIISDKNSNIYIAGNIHMQTSQFFIKKYEPSGKQFEYISDAADLYDFADLNGNAKIYTDQLNNVYGCYGVRQKDTVKFSIVKCDSELNPIWHKTFFVPHIFLGAKTTMDNNDNIYLVVNGKKIMKVDTNGNQLFLKDYKFNNSLIYDYAVRSFVADKIGNTFGAGYTRSDSNKSAFLVKYDHNGELKWERVLSNDSLNGAGCIIALDNNNNIYLLSELYSFSSRNIHISRFNQDGEKLWETVYEYQNLDGLSADIVVTGEDEFAITAQDNSYLEGYDIITAMFIPSSTPVHGINKIPDSYYLSDNYPNPFNPISNFEFRIAELVHVGIKVYDVIGREVAVL